jgi:hypothetical protein
MVQNLSTRIATDLAITSGTILTPDQYRLTAVETTRRLISGVPLDVPDGSRDIGIGSQPLYIRVRVTETFDQLTTTLEIVPVISPTTNLADANALEMYRARFGGALFRVGNTWHFPLRPISLAEAIDQTLLTPLWPTQLQYIGVKFIVSGIPAAFGAGKVTVDITPHHSPDAVTNALGATIHPRVPNAGW